ncbi:trypsin-like peptidase domain-containing protein [Natrinema thermotolerans]|uniref:Trypsin-like peptidase domain-containing protein n=1 Tax=Natrinema thermotolerans TaxID=121872 RepID=A0AAF0PBG8_9EURY|nr:trypsin-like peptidase domain-containing protein [Natrinema thermotolerans]QCC60492.1 PDZ domain-containing protein [Natrinema thermotolerans]QCC61392.1 PDZ domain-containing protein [Natrinema thermotolerans]WMT07526.1 trypsin-like peptidase domain-containing protein [Natrinema thermotolerans]WMT08158.1 trypsin-like peptidase domain-containing protein [Natrinema thermotolerans]
MSLVGVAIRVPSNERTRRRFLRTAGTISTIAALGLGGAGTGAAQDDGDSSAAGDGPNVDSEYAAVYEAAIDSVVLVSVAGMGAPDGGGRGGIGTGFVLENGYVLTNNHVVEAASEGGIELQFNNGEWRTAAVVGTDVYSDLAVLEVEDVPDVADGLSLADFRPVIGQEVLAIGNPLGLDASVSQGIVSGLDRALPSPTGFSIPAAIQTDAPINPGNSGGPLVSLDNEVLGVVFAGAGQTIGFAISAQLANRVVPALIEDGDYEHPYMGVGVRPVGPSVAEEIGLEEATGVLVAEVVPNSPADGVLEPAATGRPGTGDVIVAIEGTPIPTQDQLSSYLALEASPDETVEVEIVRDGERGTVELTLGSRPEPERQRPPIPGGPGPGERPPGPRP